MYDSFIVVFLCAAFVLVLATIAFIIVYIIREKGKQQKRKHDFETAIEHTSNAKVISKAFQVSGGSYYGGRYSGRHLLH